MAIALDLVSSGRNSTGDFLDVSHTVSGSEKVLFVLTSVQDGNHANYPIGVCTYGGVSLTKIRSDEATGNNRTEIWRLINPTSGTANIRVQATNSLGEMAVIGISLTGVDQTTPVDAQNGTSGNSAAPSTSVTSVTDNAWFLTVASSEAGFSSNGTGQTTAATLTDQSFENARATYEGPITPAGAQTQNFVTAFGASWAISSIAVRPSASATTSTSTTSTSSSTSTSTTSTSRTTSTSTTSTSTSRTTSTSTTSTSSSTSTTSTSSSRTTSTSTTSTSSSTTTSTTSTSSSTSTTQSITTSTSTTSTSSSTSSSTSTTSTSRTTSTSTTSTSSSSSSSTSTTSTSSSTTLSTSTSTTQSITTSTSTTSTSITTSTTTTLAGSCTEVLDQSQTGGVTSAGFGEVSATRYRGQAWVPTYSRLEAISFQLGSVGTQGIKVYIDSATGSIPDHSPGAEIYSFTIANATLAASFKKYLLPVPLDGLTPGAQYAFYLAPWNIAGNTYSDDYRDLTWINSNAYLPGDAIVNNAGTWSVSDTGNLDMKFETYACSDSGTTTSSSTSSSTSTSTTSTSSSTSKTTSTSTTSTSTSVTQSVTTSTSTTATQSITTSTSRSTSSSTTITVPYSFEIVKQEQNIMERKGANFSI